MRAKRYPSPFSCVAFDYFGLLRVQLAGFLSGPVTRIMWLPMLAFELSLGFWLLIKGVAMPANRRA